MKYQRGAFYELMIILLVPVYTYTGYYIGALFGVGWLGAIAGFVTGMPVILKLVFGVEYLGTGLLAAIGLGVSFFIPPAWKLNWLIVLCLLPVLRRYDLLLEKNRIKHRGTDQS